MERHVSQQLGKNDIENKIEWVENELERDSLDIYEDSYDSNEDDIFMPSSNSWLDWDDAGEGYGRTTIPLE